ncbi:hypothetical protein GGR41_002480, partial [Paenalcaligenes hominis]|nr:hypothetical protein [Paenalcaligenes hominis]
WRGDTALQPVERTLAVQGLQGPNTQPL